MRPTLVGVVTIEKGLVYINPQHVLTIRKLFGAEHEIQLSNSLTYRINADTAVLLSMFAFSIVEPTR